MSSTATKKRPVPHIQMTPALKAAMEAYIAGIPTPERCNPGDIDQVKDQLGRIARTFEDPAFFYQDEGATEIGALHRLILIADLYRQHLLALKETDV